MMKYIKSHDEYVNEKLSKNMRKFYDKSKGKIANFSLSVLFNDGVDFTKNFWEATKREAKETRQAVNILSKMIKGNDVSDSEKKFIKKQAGDIVKILPLIAIQGIPGGTIAITPLLKILGDKYNFEPFPTKNDKLDEYIDIDIDD